MKKTKLLKEVWGFILKNKAWWLIPLCLFLLLVGFLIIFGQNIAMAPFVYAIL